MSVFTAASGLQAHEKDREISFQTTIDVMTFFGYKPILSVVLIIVGIIVSVLVCYKVDRCTRRKRNQPVKPRPARGNHAGKFGICFKLSFETRLIF